ncbi:MAG: NfeD family protein [Epsilonproteobacteria bacterium]|nr:NfeD family protein [Campylobacterota bacterium]
MLEFLATTLLWWHWIAFGLLLLIIEIFTGTFIMLGLGIAAAIVGVSDFILILSLNKELLLWVIVSIVTITILFKYFKDNTPKDKSGQSDYAIGTKGIVEEPIEANGRGKVKFNTPILGNTIWYATAKEDIPILTPVKVVDIKGQLIEVEKI